MPGIYQEYARNMPGICQEYARNMPGICQEYARNMLYGRSINTTIPSLHHSTLDTTLHLLPPSPNRQPSTTTLPPSFDLVPSILLPYKGARRHTTKLGAFGSRRTTLVFFYPPLFYTRTPLALC
ncbi:hypothetical protein HanRHA438_Chr17g0818781 [Helianthus annuus]|nr:hypothetical protein HanRHA438_Chr17g0818781 [Helianthus annuus]